MIPTGPALEGEVQTDAFRWECGRIWREAAQAVGIDPLLITETIGRVAMDPWSSPSEFPRYVDKPRPKAEKITPAIFAKKYGSTEETK